MSQMAEQRPVKGFQVVILRRGHFVQQVRMAANGALPEDDHAASQNVGAFDGDGDRRTLIVTRHKIGRTKADAFAAGDVHRVDDAALAAVGAVILDDGGQHRRPRALHDAAGDKRRGGVHHVGVAGQSGQWLFNAFHFTDRQFELAADASVSAGRQRHAFQAAGGVGRQGDAAPDRQALHQHTPALTRHVRPADNVVQRNKNVFALRRAVLERDIDRKVAAADFHAFGTGGDQRAGNADVIPVAQQVVRVVQPERQTQHGGDGSQRNVAFVPGQPHPQYLLALPLAVAHHA